MKTGEKLLFMVAGAFVVFAIIAFIIMQIISARSDKPLFESKTFVNLSAEGQHGSELFRTSGCTTCHRALREGTNMGQTANLDGVGSRRSFDWLYAFLQHPEKTYGAETVDHGPYPKTAYYVASMPKKNLHAIAMFLSELKAEQGSAAAPVPPKGDSPFIDEMVKTWAPSWWKEKFKDVRDKEKPSGDATAASGDAAATSGNTTTGGQAQ